MSPARSAVIHAHFYQPPREDPWLELIEREPGAAPFHDWNRRIERECYRAVAAARLPAGTPYAWIAGESGVVRALRRHLVGERGFDRRRVTFAGYWRRGLSEEDLRAAALADATA